MEKAEVFAVLAVKGAGENGRCRSLVQRLTGKGESQALGGITRR